MHGKQQRMAGKAAAGTSSFVCVMVLALTMAFAASDGTSGTAMPSTASPSATPPSPTPPSPPKATPEVTVLNNHEVEGVLGREVRSATDENMGRIVDVLVNRGGQAVAAIIDFGGFLGVGSRKIAVDWNALHFPPPGQPGGYIKLELTRDQVAAAPEYQEGKPVVVLGALGKLEPIPE
jgi:hypothetical protein